MTETVASLAAGAALPSFELVSSLDFPRSLTQSLTLTGP